MVKGQLLPLFQIWFCCNVSQIMLSIPKYFWGANTTKIWCLRKWKSHFQRKHFSSPSAVKVRGCLCSRRSTWCLPGKWSPWLRQSTLESRRISSTRYRISSQLWAKPIKLIFWRKSKFSGVGEALVSFTTGREKQIWEGGGKTETCQREHFWARETTCQDCDWKQFQGIKWKEIQGGRKPWQGEPAGRGARPLLDLQLGGAGRGDQEESHPQPPKGGVADFWFYQIWVLEQKVEAVLEEMWRMMEPSYKENYFRLVGKHSDFYCLWLAFGELKSDQH